MESMSKIHPPDEPANRWNGVAFELFAILYALYIYVIPLFMSETLVYGIRISDIDTGFLMEAGTFYIFMAILYIIAFILLAILYFIKTSAKKLAAAGIVLPIVALHIARAVITAFHPVTMYY